MAPAQAGFFSFFKGVFTESQDYLAVVRGENSQTIDLLQAPLSFNTIPARGGGDTTIVEESALLPESGPLVGSDRDLPLGGDHISTYIVREGDSLSAIADMFGVSVNTIRWANDLGGKGPIKKDQILVILPVSGVKHVVKKGDTVASIAKKYKADEAEIIDFNGLDDDHPLILGEEVIVPDGEIVEMTPSKTATNAVGAGYYVRPIKGGKKTQGLHGYNGVDLATYVGAPVYASAAGEVVVSKSSGWNGGYGNYVVIKHPNKTQTLYAHLSKNLVKVGAKVTQGQVIGENGSTGKSTGPHLHFEVRGAKNPF